MTQPDKLFSLEEADRISKDLYENGGNMTLADALKQLADTMRENLDFREALKMIAKPALGGKTQQWVAQQALLRNKEPDNG